MILTRLRQADSYISSHRTQRLVLAAGLVLIGMAIGNSWATMDALHGQKVALVSDCKEHVEAAQARVRTKLKTEERAAVTKAQQDTVKEIFGVPQ